MRRIVEGLVGLAALVVIAVGAVYIARQPTERVVYVAEPAASNEWQEELARRQVQGFVRDGNYTIWEQPHHEPGGYVQGSR